MNFYVQTSPVTLCVHYRFRHTSTDINTPGANNLQYKLTPCNRVPFVKLTVR